MKCVWEHNGEDTLLYAVEEVGAYARGKNLEEAKGKMRAEAMAYARWRNRSCEEPLKIDIVQEKQSDLQIADADSDVLFDAERAPLSRQAYMELKELALKSARDFDALYASIPDRNASCLAPRKTFYGAVPRTAQEMYAHTKSVNAYYFGEIGVDADNDGTIYDCRKRGFEALERTEHFLDNPVVEGSYGECWSLRKVLRRFIWHDRIHARAMYRMAVQTFGKQAAENPFGFTI